MKFMNQISKLEETLVEMTGRYLDGPDSTYSIYFRTIDPPDPSDLEGRFDDLETGVRTFLQEALELKCIAPFGRVILSDEEDLISLVPYPFVSTGAVSLTMQDLIRLFSEPILRTLLPLQPTAYALSQTGQSKYETLLNPFICIGMIVILLEDTWCMLVGEWSD